MFGNSGQITVKSCNIGEGNRKAMMSIQAGANRFANVLGLLLHPSVGDMVDESVVIQGHKIRFATVDLGAEAREIRTQLLQVLEATNTQ